jgi:CRISPR-associated protein Cas5d
LDGNEVVQVKVWGERACFTRPEFGTERVSYEVMTPSAARGILEAIFWKPEFRWHVREIRVLNPVRRFSIMRNEVESRQSHRRTAPYYADEDRAQRHALMLRDVAYIVKAQITLQPGQDNVVKYLDQFRRRVRRGQCFTQPYLGTRECSAFFGPPDGTEAPIDVDADLGLMLLDFDYENRRPLLFDAKLERGVLRVPQESA